MEMEYQNMKHACGHKTEEQTYGNETEKQEWTNWIKKNKICPDCCAKAHHSANWKH